VWGLRIFLRGSALSSIYICGSLWVAWIAIWITWAFQSKRTQQREGLDSRLSYTILGWAAGYLMFSAKGVPGWWNSDIFAYRMWIGQCGVAITALGFAITFWARAILGGNWSSSVTIKVGHELVRTGPYRWVRHPIYTGMIVAMTGTALARDEWRGVAAIVLLWLSFTVKRLKEEAFMRQTFGAQYDEYSRTTGAIFPALLRRGL
jgi:protein-S-isoprenylcysteine O-methyltransferase Ste14